MEQTLKHMARWLESQFADAELRELVALAMLTTSFEDLDYWCEKGWPALYEAADCSQLVTGYIARQAMEAQS